MVYVRIAFILSQHPPQLIHGDAGLTQDGPQEARSNRFPCMQRNGHPAILSKMLEVGMRASLCNDLPAQLAERPDEFPAGDPRQRWHEADRSRSR